MDEDPSKKSSSNQPPSRSSLSSASPVMLGSAPPPPEMAARPIGYSGASLPSGGYYSYMNAFNDNKDAPYADDQQAPGTPPAPGSPSVRFQPMNMPLHAADTHSFTPSPMPTSSLDVKEISRKSMGSSALAGSPLLLQPNPTTVRSHSTHSNSKLISGNGSQGSADVPMPEISVPSPPSSPEDKLLNPPAVDTTRMHDTPASAINHDTPASTSDRLYTSHTMRFTGGSPGGGPVSMDSHIQMGVPFPTTPPASSARSMMSPSDADHIPVMNTANVTALPVPAPPPNASRKLTEAVVSSTVPTSVTLSTIPSTVPASQVPSAPTAPLPASAKSVHSVVPPVPSSLNPSINASPLVAPSAVLPPSSASTANSLPGQPSPSPLPSKPAEMVQVGIVPGSLPPLPPMPPNAAPASPPSPLKGSASPLQAPQVPTPSPPAPVTVPVVPVPASAAVPVPEVASLAPPAPPPSVPVATKEDVAQVVFPSVALPPPAPVPAPPPAPALAPALAAPKPVTHETPLDILMASSSSSSSSSSTVPEIARPVVKEEPPVAVVAPPPLPEVMPTMAVAAPGPTPTPPPPPPPPAAATAAPKLVTHETPLDILMASSSSSSSSSSPSTVPEVAPPVVVVAPPPPPEVMSTVAAAAPDAAPPPPPNQVVVPEVVSPPPPPADATKSGSNSSNSRHSHRHHRESGPSSSRDSRTVKPDSLLPAAPLAAPPQPPEGKKERIAAVVPHLGVYTPLVVQHDYLKTDIKRIAATSTYSFEELANYTFLLQPFQGKSLEPFEPVDAVRERYRKFSQVQSLRVCREKSAKADRKRLSILSKESKAESSTKTKEEDVDEDEKEEAYKSTVRGVREITVNDFSDSLVGYDNIMLALSFCLFGTVMYCNDLTAAARANFQHVHESQAKRDRRLKEEKRTEAEKQTSEKEKERDVLSIDTETQSSSYSSTYTYSQSGGAEPLLRISAVSLFRWLNEIGIDVLVTSADRTAGTSFCAKRCDVPRNGLHTGTAPQYGTLLPPVVDAAAAATPAAGSALAEGEKLSEEPSNPFTGWGEQQSTAVQDASRRWPQPPSPENAKRLLVALEFDRKKMVWSPITIDLPIRETAAVIHKQRRLARKKLRRKQARLASERTEQERREKAQAVLDEKYGIWRTKCQQKNNEWLDLQDALYADRAQEVEKAAMAKKSTGVVVGETSSGDDGTGNVLPFAGMHYPTIVQTDFGLGPVLAQSTNKHFSTRIKILGIVGFSVLSLAFGLALVIFSSATLRSCVANSTARRCLTEAQLNASTCAMNMHREQYASAIPNRYLYGKPVAPGNAVIVALALTLAQLIFGVLVIFFAIRFLAVGSKWPCFFYLLQVAHVLLTMGMVGFSAYALYRFHAQRHTFSCDYFHPQDKQQCASLVGQCSGIVYQVHERATSPHTSLALAVLFMVFNIFLFFLSFLPNLPSKRIRAKLTPAVADTNAFRKSDFAPDGLRPPQKRQLDEHLSWQLHKEVRRSIKHKDKFLTHSVTIGEMMKANREQSIRRMELNKKRPKNRWKVHHRKRKAHIAPLSYMQVPGESDSLSDLAPGQEREVPLPPDILLKVEQVTASLTGRRRHQPLSRESPVLPLAPERSALARRSPLDVPFPDSPLKRATTETGLHDSSVPFRSRGKRDSEEAVSFSPGSSEGRQPSVNTTKPGALSRHSSYSVRINPTAEKAADRGPAQPRRPTSSFVVMPSFSSIPIASTLEPTSSAAPTAAAPAHAGLAKRLPSPGTEGPRMNPFVTATASDRIQRKNLMELEPQISKIVERLKGTNTSVSSSKV